MKNSEIFAKAAKLIQRRGLSKGSFGTPQGPVCLIGAIYAAVTGQPDAHSYVALHGYELGVAQVTDEYIRPDYRFASHWNDAPDTTADEVVQVLQFMALAEKDAGR